LLLLVACAGGASRPVVDLTPWGWTWSQAALGDTLVRYGYPDERPDGTQAEDAAPFAVAAGASGASGSRISSHRYRCAREDRASDAPCTVFLDFWLVELATPLPSVTLTAYEERCDRIYATPETIASRLEHGLVRDSWKREWYHRSFSLASGATFSHYSRPLDARHALVVTSSTTREPDRVVARDLARDAIERIRIDAAAGAPR
jgi:hypothetical protein